MPRAIMEGVAASLGIRMGFVEDERRAATPHTVDCLGLTRENLRLGRFERELNARRAWIEDQCSGGYEIEPIGSQGCLIGRRFRFGCLTEAAAFKIWFPTRL